MQVARVAYSANPEVWTPWLDAKIRSHVEKFGLKFWSELTKNINAGLTARQVRERWSHTLDPSVNHGPWTADEDARLKQLYSTSGGSWAVMAVSMPGRTDVQIKDRWFVLNHAAFTKAGCIDASLNNIQASELDELFGSAGAEYPASPPSSGKRKLAETSSAVPLFTTVKKPRDTPPCTNNGMRKVTINGSLFKQGMSPFAGINAMLSKSKIKDARKQKWDGLGRL